MAEKKKETVRKVTVTRSLACILTAYEFKDRAQALAKANQDIVSEELDQDSVKKEMKASLAKLQAECDRLAAIVGRGSEMRNIQVEITKDYERGKIIETRLDTGEVILEREMDESERQIAFT